MIPFWLAVFKRPAGRLLWPGLAGNYGPAGRGKRLYASEKYDLFERKESRNVNDCIDELYFGDQEDIEKCR